MKSLLSFISGVVFALGLGISGMTRPVKVIGFLDFAGHWDPSLAFVMIGAIAVYFVAYRWIRIRSAPLLTDRFSVPQRTDVDRNLVVGAAVFGAGWGLGGFCPAPRLPRSRRARCRLWSSSPQWPPECIYKAWWRGRTG